MNTLQNDIYGGGKMVEYFTEFPKSLKDFREIIAEIGIENLEGMRNWFEEEDFGSRSRFKFGAGERYCVVVQNWDGISSEASMKAVGSWENFLRSRKFLKVLNVNDVCSGNGDFAELVRRDVNDGGLGFQVNPDADDFVEDLVRKLNLGVENLIGVGRLELG